MMTSLLKFIICSGVLLFVYHLLLKSKSTYRFNRFFLLASVVFSMLVPFITIRMHEDIIPAVAPVKERVIVMSDAIVQTVVGKADDVPAKEPINYNYVVVFVYCAISGLLFFRFTKNIYHIAQTGARNVNIRYKDGRVVLIKQKLTPHTFFNRIFLNEEDYYRDKITDQVFQHELAHASQWHSADVVFIELIQALCWFNPFMPFYKKAIQLNHEFLADEAVLQDECDITSYQYQLLNSAAGLKGFSVASQFNYSLTKKRLIMMTRKTSALSAVLCKAAIFAIMIAAFIMFCNAANVGLPKQVVNLKRALINAVQDTTRPDNFPKLISTRYPEYPYSKEGVSEQLMSEYTALSKQQYDWLKEHRTIKILPADRARMTKIFQHMSRAQQKQQFIIFEYRSQPLAPNKPGPALFESLKNEKEYGIWIDEKHVPNTELNKYKPVDIGQYFISRLTGKARNNKSYKYQADLMTVDYYNNYRKEALANKYESLMLWRPGYGLKFDPKQSPPPVITQ